MAAAFGVPDSKIPGSERVMASIQLKEDYEGKVTVDEIRDFCKDHLAPYAVPKYVEFRDDMPLTVTEKVFKKELRDEAVKKMKERGIQGRDSGIQELRNFGIEGLDVWID